MTGSIVDQMEGSRLTWGGGENRLLVGHCFCILLLSISQGAFYKDTLRLNKWMSRLCSFSHKVEAGGLVGQTQSTPPPKGLCFTHYNRICALLALVWIRLDLISCFCQTMCFSVHFSNRCDDWWLSLVAVVFISSRLKLQAETTKWARSEMENNLAGFCLIQ